MNFYDLSELFQAFWPVLLSIIGFTAWLARLEYKTLTALNAIKDLKDRVIVIEAKGTEVTELKNLVIAIDSKLSVLVEGYNGK